MNFAKKATALAAAAACLNTFVAVGAARADALDEVTVTATRTPGTLARTPASVTVVTQDDIDERQANSLSEALKLTPNVEFGGGARLNAQIPTIRGQQGSSIAILVDGARQNDVTGGNLRSPVYVDPYFLGRVEVLRGSSSALYGSGAMGGALVISTLSAKDLLQDGQTFGAGIRTGWSTSDDSRHLNARLYAQSGPVDTLIALGKHGWGAIRQGGGSYLTPNDGSSGTALVKVGYEAGSGTRWELTHNAYESSNLQNNNAQTDSTISGAPAIQPVRTRQLQTTLGVTTRNEAGEKEIVAKVYNTLTSWQTDRYGSGVYNLSETQTVGGSFQHNVGFQPAGLGAHRLVYGMDHHRDMQTGLTSTGGVIGPNSVIPSGTQTVTGVFVQDEIALAGSWRLVPALRFDRFNTVANDPALSTTTNSHLSPKMTLAWDHHPGLTVYGSFGEAYRAPTLIELYSYCGTTTCFNQFRANANLKPELSLTSEVGLSYQRKSVYQSNDLFKLRSAIFDSRVQDLINNTSIGTYARTAAPFGSGTIFQAQNVQNARRWGGELEMAYQWPRWQAALTYATVRAVDASTGTDLFANPDKLTLSLRHQFTAAVSAQWSNSLVSAQSYDSTVNRRRDAYNVHDVFVTWQPVGQKYKLDFGVTNLFDDRYFIYQSSNLAARTPEAGRSVRLAFSWDF